MVGIACYGRRNAFMASLQSALEKMKNKVEQLRVAQGWTKVELGDRLNVSRQTIHAIESGRYDPSLPLALAIAKLFGRSVEQIFGEDNSVDRVKEGRKQKAATREADSD
jgi:putative transcriptional regulator